MSVHTTSQQVTTTSQDQEPFTARTYVLDTSVLLADPKALSKFDEHEVVVPLVVLKELEAKRSDEVLGWAARTVLRTLSALIEDHPHDSIRHGLPVGEVGGTVRIEHNHRDTSMLPEAIAFDRTHDTRVLTVASNLAREAMQRQEERGAREVVTLVTKDLPMRVLAESVGVACEFYRGDVVAFDTGWTGMLTLETTREVIEALRESGESSFDLGQITATLSPAEATRFVEAPLNTGLLLRAGQTSALARITPTGAVAAVVPGDIKLFSLSTRSAPQALAATNLTDARVGVVSLGGAAGTGKSILALSAALHAVLVARSAKKVVVFRPLYAVGGQDLGFLPGTEEEKMGPWAAAVGDALAALGSQVTVREVLARGQLEVLPVTHVRGRTFTETIMIIDEAQQLDRPTLLTVISRAGQGTRVFLTHDVAQRDNLRVGRHDGIAAVVELLRGEALFAHTTLTKSERSPIAEMATRLLDGR